MSTNRRGQVIVITGASSGIGRATACRFAAEGAKLTLVARDVEKLERVAEDCRAKGAAEVRVEPADVTDSDRIEQIAVRAAEHFGRLDVWVNNAGIGVLGSFTETPVAEHRRVIETNLLGYLYGSHAALKIFRKQGFGTLINNASVSSRLVVPNLSSYTASKFAIRGLTRSLAQDLRLEKIKNIHVCQVNPGVIDTPAFEHAANHTGYRIPMNAPMSSPDRVAKAIVRLSHRPRLEVFVGFTARLGAVVFRFGRGLRNGFCV